MRRFFKRISLWWTLPAVIALLLSVILSHFPTVAEYVFARGLFRVVAVPLGFTTSILPFSLTECLVIMALPAVIFFILWLIRRLKRAEDRRERVEKGLRKTAWAVSILFAAYMLLHGLNFHRLPVAELMDLDTRQQDAEFLQQVCYDLARTASAEREKLPQDDEGNIAMDISGGEILRQAVDGYTALQEEYPFLWGGTWQPKSVMLSHPWSYTGITGMYFPFLGEANVNTDTPVFTMPFTAAHELAHTRGFAREDECNFLAFLTCRSHPEALYRYAGAYMAYVHCENALYAYDPDMSREVRATAVSEGMLRDIALQQEYWKQFEGEIKEVSTEVNNAFLTVQGEEDGVLSYDRVVALILAYYQTEVWAE